MKLENQDLGKKNLTTENIPMIMWVENTENDNIIYVGYNLIVGVASRILMVHLDMTYVNIQLTILAN